MKKHDEVDKILFSQEQLEKRISELSVWVNETYKDEKEPLIVVGLLKGALPFMMQLIKGFEIDCILDFMIVSSYGDNFQSTNNVKIILDLDRDITNKNILIVEEIIDTGQTLEKVKKILLARKPKSLKIITLLEKKIHRKTDIFPDIYGFEIGDEFVIGFGLDLKDRLRNLPYIGTYKIEKQ